MFGILFTIGIVYLIVMLLCIGVLYENSLVVPVEPQTKLEYRVIIIKRKNKMATIEYAGVKASGSKLLLVLPLDNPLAN